MVTRQSTTRTSGPTIATSLGDLVTTRAGAARVLDGFGLDYCCGGARTLADACAAGRLDAHEVLAAVLDATVAGDEPGWAAMGPAELVDHLEATHHAYLHVELDRLGALAVKVAGVHGGRHRELADVLALYEELQADLEPHLRKEERILFPMIRELAATTGPVAFHCGSLQSPISVMLSEHDRAGELLAALRAATHGYQVPADGCASYRALYEGLAELESDTHRHVHKENNLLFPAVLALEAGRGHDAWT